MTRHFGVYFVGPGTLLVATSANQMSEYHEYHADPTQVQELQDQLEGIVKAGYQHHQHRVIVKKQCTRSQSSNNPEQKKYAEDNGGDNGFDTLIIDSLLKTMAVAMVLSLSLLIHCLNNGGDNGFEQNIVDSLFKQ